MTLPCKSWYNLTNLYLVTFYKKCYIFNIGETFYMLNICPTLPGKSLPHKLEIFRTVKLKLAVMKIPQKIVTRAPYIIAFFAAKYLKI